ncbi:MAG TPA: peptidoglycan binding domain-containing protein, partial [Blastococcus sp.]|nr:peptidoglycan binding domain-containing protein [Blastococcus sp.]
MSQDAPPHDQTVRMPGERPATRPPLHASRPAARSDVDSDLDGVASSPDEADATRPVTNDWMLGAPDPEPDPDPDPDPDRALAELEQQFAPDPVAGDDPPAGDAPTSGASSSWWRRRGVLVPAAAVLALAAAYGVDLASAQGSIPRSTTVSGIDIGGLSPAAATSKLEHDLSPRARIARTIVADGTSSAVSPAAAGLTFDIPATVRAAAEHPLAPWTRLASLVSSRTVAPVVATDRAALTAELDAVAAKIDRAPVDATIAFTGTTAHVVPPVDGLHLDRTAAASALTAALTGRAATSTPIQVPVQVTHVHVDAAAAKRTLDSSVTPALAGPVRVVGSSGTPAEVTVPAIAASLAFTPAADGTLALRVDPAALQKALGDTLKVFGSPA